MMRSHDVQQWSGSSAEPARFRWHAALGALAVLGGCGLDAGEPAVSEVSSAVTVASYVTTSCTTAVVIGLSSQIADEVGCMSPSSLVRFAAGNGITITSNAVLPYLAANARTDLMAVGNVQINSAFRTVAQQYLLLQWFNLGRCGITAAAAVGQSNHESGRAVDLANYSTRISAMASRGWSHDVPGDPVHFDHLGSADIRGKDTLAFQRLWNRNHPTDKISEDGAYGPQTEARLKQAPATGFATGASCLAAVAAPSAQVVAIDGPDRIAPGATAHYRVTVTNTTAADWPATTRLVVTGGASQLYDAASWASPTEVGAIGAAIPAGTQGVVELDVVAPAATEPTALAAELALTDGTVQVGTVSLAVTVTPDGDANLSGDSDDQTDGPAMPGGDNGTGGNGGTGGTGGTDGTGVAGGCAAGDGAGWLAFAPVLGLLVRRRRR